MIKNVVFDLGNVLINFSPSEYLSLNGYSIQKRCTILSDIFESIEWALLDQGKISTTDAIERISLKSSLKKEEIGQIFEDRMKIFYSLDQNIKTLPAIKKQGFKLYYITNFHADLIEEVMETYDFFRYFDGGIISAYVRLSKPDPAIYRIFLNKYNLFPGECLFIDDSEKNVIAAKEVGMIGFATYGSRDFSKELMTMLNNH